MSLFCAAKGQMWHMGRIKVVQSLIASQGVHSVLGMWKRYIQCFLN